MGLFLVFILVIKALEQGVFVMCQHNPSLGCSRIFGGTWICCAGNEENSRECGGFCVGDTEIGLDLQQKAWNDPALLGGLPQGGRRENPWTGVRNLWDLGNY